jgi:hypothetical protein
MTHPQTGPKRTEHEREADLEVINRWYLQGLSMREIAERLTTELHRPYEISYITVSKDLKTIRERWQKSTALALDEHRAKELAKIDTLEAEYWSEYFLSKAEQESTVNRAGLDTRTGRQVSSYETRRVKKTGNPAYLQGIERCIGMRIKLLGLNAPERVEIAWREKAVQDIRAGLVSYGALTEQFDEDLANELFRIAGKPIVVSTDGEDAAELSD